MNLDTLNVDLEARGARERLAWAVDTYGDKLLFTSSFGPGSGALLHLWSEVAHGLPVHFIDTGYLFPETLAYRDTLVSALGLNLQVLKPVMERGRFLQKYGLTLYRDDPDQCCAINKVEPLQAALPGKEAWVSGLRRDQSPTRAATPIVLATDGPVKVHPIADWHARDVYQYLQAHGVPEHPLFEQGYVSVGCAPCTRPVMPGEDDERAGRWAGSQKTECGLHTFLGPAKG